MLRSGGEPENFCFELEFVWSVRRLEAAFITSESLVFARQAKA